MDFRKVSGCVPTTFAPQCIILNGYEGEKSGIRYQNNNQFRLIRTIPYQSHITLTLQRMKTIEVK